MAVHVGVWLGIVVVVIVIIIIVCWVCSEYGRDDPEVLPPRGDLRFLTKYKVERRRVWSLAVGLFGVIPIPTTKTTTTVRSVIHREPRPDDKDQSSIQREEQETKVDVPDDINLV